MRLRLRWTEQAVNQLGGIAEYIGLSSPVYAEQVIARITARLQQAIDHPQSGRVVPEFNRPDVRELVEPPYRIIYRPVLIRSRCLRSCTAGGIWEAVMFYDLSAG